MERGVLTRAHDMYVWKVNIYFIFLISCFLAVDLYYIIGLVT